MACQFTEKDKKSIQKFQTLDWQNLRSHHSKVLTPDQKFFRLQYGSHGGNHVYFNRNGKETRFGLCQEKVGTMYVSLHEMTAMKEVFQNVFALTEVDLRQYFMGEIQLKQTLSVLDTTILLARSNVKLHELTSPNRHVTQMLAKWAYRAGFDGIEFLSNVTGKNCWALWADTQKYTVAGIGLAETVKQTVLSELVIDGIDAIDVLIEQLNISVEAT
ncbi:RES family NAD+ phosphorylase (plasmid) [Photobacterium sp. GJ3]|uniref:RES family NAD+ phosphorylase n=1 Tax=Photobacterium sp. GJ3 TaxID=2829502 RepID=UPI001B8AEA68|nr:RES family NAD+ phosphorylase [Photobacterium sp. GJ3]QUJ70221.1 RES family NAD+ phosphorylase [Photobacterium sp. GJ3]